jgi:2-oxoglutarate ferredoxin oxidoreductase subunit alpha
MPTWTAQGDLGFILNASQDEFPRFVLTPGDAQEAFELTRIALELAEKYQTLVMLVSDKYLSESRLTFKLDSTVFKNKRQAFNGNPQPDESGFFPRYLESENGVSPRTIPGTAGGTYIANSYEHDKYGLAAEEGSIRLEQMDKRFRKFDAMRSEVPRQYEEREAGAEVTLVSFGSTKGVIRAASTLLKKDGIPTNTLNLSWIWPFPKDQVKDIVGSGRPIVVEGNKQGQLARLIAQETGMIINDHIRRYDGRPFYAEDIASEVKKLV